MTAQTASFIALENGHWHTMLAEVQNRSPIEACGLIAVEAMSEPACIVARQVIPVTNSLHSPGRFRMEPHEQLAAFNEFERQGWDQIAIFHSHPAGPDHPSSIDLAEITYPEAYHLIWFHTEDRWQCKGYRLSSESYEEIPIIVRVE
jgi:proteasome lid subunit RPN8/RPN11